MKTTNNINNTTNTIKITPFVCPVCGSESCVSAEDKRHATRVIPCVCGRCGAFLYPSTSLWSWLLLIYIALLCILYIAHYFLNVLYDVSLWSGDSMMILAIVALFIADMAVKRVAILRVRQPSSSKLHTLMAERFERKLACPVCDGEECIPLGRKCGRFKAFKPFPCKHCKKLVIHKVDSGTWTAILLVVLYLLIWEYIPILTESGFLWVVYAVMIFGVIFISAAADVLSVFLSSMDEE